MWGVPASDPRSGVRRKLGDVVQDLIVEWSQELIEECGSANDEIAGAALFRRANYHLIGWGLFDQSREKAILYMEEAMEHGYPSTPLLTKVKNDPNYHRKQSGDFRDTKNF